MTSMDLSHVALSAICERFHVRELDLCGSAADGRFDPMRSDLDFLVSFDGLSGSACAETFFGLQDGLAGLLGRKIDLLTASALENPFLGLRAHAQRRRLYPAAR